MHRANKGSDTMYPRGTEIIARQSQGGPRDETMPPPRGPATPFIIKSNYRGGRRSPHLMQHAGGLAAEHRGVTPFRPAIETSRQDSVTTKAGYRALMALSSNSAGPTESRKKNKSHLSFLRLCLFNARANRAGASRPRKTNSAPFPRSELTCSL